MILFGDNPDRYDTDTLPYYWDQAGTNYSPGGTPGVRADGYLGRPALTGIGGHAFVGIYPRLPDINPGSKFKGFTGGRYLFESFPAEPEYLFAFVTGGGQIQIMAVINPDGSLSIYRGFFAEELKGTVAPLSTDQFYRLGFTATMASSNGTATIWNGTTRLLTFAGLTADTEEFEGFGWGGVVWGLPENCALSHYYVGDVFGTQPSIVPGFYADIRTVTGAGSFVDWLPTAGTYPTVLNVAPPDFINRLQADTDLQRFSAEMDAITNRGPFYGVQSTQLVRNGFSDDPQYRPLLERGGIGDDAGLLGDLRIPSPATMDWRAIRRLDWGDPFTGEGWSKDTINSARWGGQVRVAA